MRDVQRCMESVPRERARDFGKAALSPFFPPLEGSGPGAGHCGQKGGNVSGICQTERRMGWAGRESGHRGNAEDMRLRKIRSIRPRATGPTRDVGQIEHDGGDSRARGASRGARAPSTQPAGNHRAWPLPLATDAKDAFHWQPAALTRPASRQSHRRISERIPRPTYLINYPPRRRDPPSTGADDAFRQQTSLPTCLRRDRVGWVARPGLALI